MILLTARILAFAVAIPTLLTMMRPDRWGPHHLFFVPDLIFIIALPVAALLPARPAHRALTVGYAFAAGVITTASFSYVARDAVGEGWLAMATAALCTTLAILLTATSPPTPKSAEVTP